MKKVLAYSLGFLFPFLLSGCFEWVEDVELHPDFSGKYKLTLNLSASKVKLSSMLALDSIKGRKVPTIEEIEKELAAFTELINDEEGISNAQMDADFDDYMFRFSLEFKYLEQVYPAMIRAASQLADTTFLLVDDLPKWTVKRDEVLREHLTIHKEQLKKWQSHEDVEELKKAKYTAILRLPYIINSVSPPNSRVSKNQKAMLYAVSPYMLIHDPNLFALKASRK